MRGTRPERALLQHVDEQKIAADRGAIVVACSGGPDSVALASLLARLAPKHEWRLVLAHVNHHVRESSWQDECIVAAVGARLGLPVRVAALSPTGKPRPSEADLRELRYAALAEIAQAEGADTVVTAHTAEDQTETVLLALFRGTGLRGLAGMPSRRRLSGHIQLVRPLLRLSRRDLHAELASALPYARDPSNVDPAYRRNSVRAALGPLRDEFPRLDEAVARCAEIVAGELRADPRGDARRRVREALSQHAGLADVPFERIEAALRARHGRIFIKDGVDVLKS